MRALQTVLATLIQNGKVTVETPGIDLEELRRAVRNEAEQTLEEIRGVVFEEEMTDAEKVEWLQNRLER